MRSAANAKDAVNLARYFKTGPGDYGEGDVFLGLRVPAIRTLVREFRGMPHPEIKRMVSSKYHEERLAALLLMVDAYKRADDALRERIYKLYLSSRKYINNWDLVDLSAPNIVGAWSLSTGQGMDVIRSLAKSKSLWDRRISVLATFAFIKEDQFDLPLEMALTHLHDKHDLMHKAAGWMLREIGSRDQDVLEGFLKTHCRVMPRTMLRYAIEKFPDAKRRAYLAGTV
ncbi:MAG: DNA alkylation repair protein [Spirochaetia bacterium]|nr:DNA alkylation repair protein [Spirochaetia bacterium]